MSVGVAGRWEWRLQTIKGAIHCSENGLLRGTCSSAELHGDACAGGGSCHGGKFLCRPQTCNWPAFLICVRLARLLAAGSWVKRKNEPVHLVESCCHQICCGQRLQMTGRKETDNKRQIQNLFDMMALKKETFKSLKLFDDCGEKSKLSHHSKARSTSEFLYMKFIMQRIRITPSPHTLMPQDRCMNCTFANRRNRRKTSWTATDLNYRWGWSKGGTWRAVSILTQ